MNAVIFTFSDPKQASTVSDFLNYRGIRAGVVDTKVAITGESVVASKELDDIVNLILDLDNSVNLYTRLNGVETSIGATI